MDHVWLIFITFFYAKIKFEFKDEMSVLRSDQWMALKRIYNKYIVQ